MALCGSLQVSSYTTAGRPTSVNGGMYFDTTIGQLVVAYEGSWYKAEGTSTTQPAVDLCYAAIGGGGAGGTGNGTGGGGAGGVLVSSANNIATNTWFCVAIGSGGAGSTTFGGSHNPGGNTCFGAGIEGQIAYGGGHGSGQSDQNDPGGSGGGGGNAAQGGKLGCLAQGNRGGNSSVPVLDGGGGGGYSQEGCTAVLSVTSGCGGIGSTFLSSYCVAAGGTGGGDFPTGGRTGGGGAGGFNGGDPLRCNGYNATANTGSGGGGGPGDRPANGQTGSGGSGVIFLFYKSSVTMFSSPTVSQTNSFDPVSGRCFACITGGVGCICWA